MIDIAKATMEYMTMLEQALLLRRPDDSVLTIPFPIPHDRYDHCMELLEALEIGDACRVEEIDRAL